MRGDNFRDVCGSLFPSLDNLLFIHRGCLNRQEMEDTQTQPETTYVSPIGDPLVIGDPGDVLPSPQEVLEVVSILQRAGMTFCVTQISALIYYGAPRVTSVKYPERFQLTV